MFIMDGYGFLLNIILIVRTGWLSRLSDNLQCFSRNKRDLTSQVWQVKYSVKKWQFIFAHNLFPQKVTPYINKMGKWECQIFLQEVVGRDISHMAKPKIKGPQIYGPPTRIIEYIWLITQSTTTISIPYPPLSALGTLEFISLCPLPSFEPQYEVQIP